MVERLCAECGEALVRRANEKPGRFAKRRFCSHRCASAVGSRRAAAKRLGEPRTFIERNGYLMQWVPGRAQPRGRSTSERASGGSGAYVYVHRLVMEAHLGRRLTSHEEVHHVNRDRKDNRVENLRLFDSKSAHRATEEADARGLKQRCPVCGESVRRGRTYCSRRCYLAR